MKIIDNAISENLCDEVYKFAIDTINGKNIRNKELYTGVWTNYSWPDHVRNNGPMVLGMLLPEFLQKQLEEELIKLGIYNLESDIPFDSYSASMIHVWPPGSYIGKHKDEQKTYTIYVNRDWEESDGGLFKWYKTGIDWETIVPKFNTLVYNEGGIPHYTTPVLNKNKFRVSLQGFIFNKNLTPPGGKERKNART